MLHETVVAWMRERLKNASDKGWAGSFDDYDARLKACAAYINDEHDVAGLCLGLPKLLAELDRRRGDRLCKWLTREKGISCKSHPSPQRRPATMTQQDTSNTYHAKKMVQKNTTFTLPCLSQTGESFKSCFLKAGVCAYFCMHASGE